MLQYFNTKYTGLDTAHNAYLTVWTSGARYKACQRFRSPTPLTKRNIFLAFKETDVEALHL
jgi:hypothetical protein